VGQSRRGKSCCYMGSSLDRERSHVDLQGDDDLDEAFSQVPDGEDDDEAIDEDGQDEEDKDADTPAAGPTGPSTPAIETPLETPELELALPTNPAAPNEPSSLSKPPINAETPSAPPSIAVTPAPVEAADSADPIPSNAIELTNVAPGHVEEGTGDLGNEAGMEVHVPEAEAAPTSAPAVDEDVTMDGGDEPQVPVTEDAGLVHGEMEPPIAALAVTEGDHPPPEMEKEE